MAASVHVDPGYGTIVEQTHERSSGRPPESDAEFEALYADFSSQVRTVVRRYLSDTVVEDVVQEAFLQAYRSGLHRDRAEVGDLATWKVLAGITRNRTIDVLRKRMRGIEEVADDAVAGFASTSHVADPHLQLVASSRREGIAEAFDSLCETQRRVLFLRDVDGLRYAEIAAMEGMTVDAVKAALARGRRSFREAYATIAEQRGLNVVLGGGLMAGLRARLRRVRDRVAGAVQHAGTTFAGTSPVVAQAIVAAIVIGGVAVVGAGMAAADNGAPTPIAHRSAPDPTPTPSKSPVEPRLAALASADGGSGAANGTAPGQAPGATPVGALPRVPTQASHSTSAGVDTDDLGVDDVPVSARLKTAVEAGVDAAEGNANAKKKAANDVMTIGLDTSGVAGQDVDAGCGAGYSNATTGWACGTAQSGKVTPPPPPSPPKPPSPPSPPAPPG